MALNRRVAFLIRSSICGQFRPARDIAFFDQRSSRPGENRIRQSRNQPRTCAALQRQLLPYRCSRWFEKRAVSSTIRSLQSEVCRRAPRNCYRTRSEGTEQPRQTELVLYLDRTKIVGPTRQPHANHSSPWMALAPALEDLCFLGLTFRKPPFQLAISASSSHWPRF